MMIGSTRKEIDKCLSEGCSSMHGAFSVEALHASVCRNQAIHPGIVLVVS